MPFGAFFMIEAVVLSFKCAPRPPPFTNYQFVEESINVCGVEVWRSRPSNRCPVGWHVTYGQAYHATQAQSAVLDKIYPGRFPVALYSPVYFKTNGAEWKDNLHLVLSAVNNRMYWRPNAFAGVYVHVRHGRGIAFSLPELKRIAMLVCRFEEAIDTLPPVQRSLKLKDFLSSNRFNSEFRDLTLSEVYSRIQGTTDIRGLCALLIGREQWPIERKCTGGFGNFSGCFRVKLIPNPEPTVAFYQHEGTISAEPAIKWAEFIFRFMEYALNTSETIIMEGGSTVEDLAHLILLP